MFLCLRFVCERFVSCGVLVFACFLGVFVLWFVFVFVCVNDLCVFCDFFFIFFCCVCVCLVVSWCVFFSLLYILFF